MVRISSRVTTFYKRIFPAVWLAFLTLFAFGGVLSGAARLDPLFVVVPILMAAIGFAIFKKLLWDLVDEVYDSGDHLVIRNESAEETVALRDIMNVNASIFTNPKLVTLRLVHPGRFGTEIMFIPVQTWTWMPFAKNQIAEDLIVRIDRARRAV